MVEGFNFDIKSIVKDPEELEEALAVAEMQKGIKLTKQQESELVEYGKESDSTSFDKEEENKGIVEQVYKELKDRKIHPSGKFDKAGRWYADNQDLISVRSPSRSFPYSEMVACRTKKYVKAVCEKFSCKTYEELRAKV